MPGRGGDMKNPGPLLAVLLLLNPAAHAQVIQFDSVPDPLKLPRDLHFGEVTGVAVNSKGHVFVLSRGNTSGPAYAAAAASSSARSAGTCMPGRSATRCAPTAATTSGSRTRARTWW